MRKQLSSNTPFPNSSGKSSGSGAQDRGAGNTCGSSEHYQAASQVMYYSPGTNPNYF